jgi:hypothetical protein
LGKNKTIQLIEPIWHSKKVGRKKGERAATSGGDRESALSHLRLLRRESSLSHLRLLRRESGGKRGGPGEAAKRYQLYGGRGGHAIRGLRWAVGA